MDKIKCDNYPCDWQGVAGEEDFSLDYRSPQTIHFVCPKCKEVGTLVDVDPDNVPPHERYSEDDWREDR